MHRIYKRKGDFLRFENYLVGVKRFRNENGILKPYYNEEPFNFFLSSDGNIICKNKLRKQKVFFEVPILNLSEQDCLKTAKNYLHGVCIYPFIQNEYFLPDTLIIFVAFKQEDILFYDGTYINVKEFTIFNPDKMKKFLDFYGDLIEKYNLLRYFGLSGWLSVCNLYQEIKTQKIKAS